MDTETLPRLQVVQPDVTTRDQGSIRPGVVVWLAERLSRDELARMEAMRLHPAGTARGHLRGIE